MDYETFKKEGTELNNAFVEAFVSYASYDNRRWMIEGNIKKIENPLLNILNNFKMNETEISSKKAFEMYAALFSKNKFQPVNLSLPVEGTYKSKLYGFTTEFYSSIGDYEALNNLARACIVKSKNTDGTYTLHLSYRGTDTDARTFKEFVTDAYLDMSAYYAAFKPLEEAVLAYVNDPANNITKLNVSGHSLGGAMVPEFFKSAQVKKCKIPMEGITYGAPGNKKTSFYNIFPSIYHGIKMGKFLSIGKAVMDVLLLPKKEKIDERITQYSHLGDLIPRIASLIYEKEGNQVNLEDYASTNLKNTSILENKISTSLLQQKRPSNLFSNVISTNFSYITPRFLENGKNFVQKVFTFQFHDMLRYMMNIETKSQILIQQFSKADNNFKTVINEVFPDIIEFQKYKKRYDTVYNSRNTNNIMARTITHNLIEKSKAQGLHKGKLPFETNAFKFRREKIQQLRNEALLKDINNLNLKPI